MALYEHVVISRQDISPQQAEALNDQIKALIEEGGGSVAKIEYWGLRNLTYRIKKNRKAHYALMDIEAPGAAIHEMERQMRINEDILRYMTVAVEAHEEGPSAMMQKRDRDDRPRRDGDDRGPRRDFGDRPRRDFGDRPPRGDRGDRGDRGPREDRGERPPRAEREAPQQPAPSEAVEGSEQQQQQ